MKWTGRNIAMIERYWRQGGGAAGWTNYMVLTANTTETIQFARVPIQPEMKALGADIRFVKNVAGTGKELLFMPYEYLTSDENYHYFKVAHRNYFSEASATFHAIYGNASAVSESNPYRMALEGDYFYNDGSRGINYDVVNVLGGYDKLLAGPGDASEEKNWPSICNDPLNKQNVYLIYKDDVDNAHSGTATSKVSLIKSTDGGETFGSPITVVDPPEADIGATNAVITSVYDGATLVLIVVYSRIDFTTFTPRTYSVRSVNGGLSWSTPIMVGPDRWNNVGGQALTLSDGQCLFMTHQDGDDTAGEWRPTAIRTRDAGVSFDWIEIISPTNTQLNETALVERKDPDTRLPLSPPVVYAVHRNEDVTTFNHQYGTDITCGVTMSVGATTENPWFDSAGKTSRFTALRLSNNRVLFMGGDQVGKMLYSDDECQTFHPFPYDILRTSPYTARRNYLCAVETGNNGEIFMAWASNKLTDGSDLYGNFFDGYNMSLRAVANATLTDSRTRPIDLEPGIRINGSLIPGFRITSSASVTVPTSHPTQVTFASTPHNFSTGDTLICRALSNSYFQGTVDASSTPTSLVVNSTANVGSGTRTSWVIDKTSNLQSDQAFVSGWTRNGKNKPFKLTINGKLPDLGWVGLKKDETRALAVVTISDEGDEDDVITIKWAKTSTYTGSIAGLGVVARYTVQNGDTIADVVNGLVVSANEIGICPVTTNDGTTLTLQAPRGNAATINGIPLTIETTGTVAGSSGNFAGGAAAESVTATQNVIHFNHASNNLVAEQANDGFTSSLTAPKDADNIYTITWEDDLITGDVNGTSKTKTPADGSGICDFDAMIHLYTGTSLAFPQAYIEATKIMTEPVDQTIPTVGSLLTGSFTERSDGLGLS